MGPPKMSGTGREWERGPEVWGGRTVGSSAVGMREREERELARWNGWRRRGGRVRLRAGLALFSKAIYCTVTFAVNTVSAQWAGIGEFQGFHRCAGALYLHSGPWIGCRTWCISIPTFLSCHLLQAHGWRALPSLSTSQLSHAIRDSSQSQKPDLRFRTASVATMRC